MKTFYEHVVLHNDIRCVLFFVVAERHVQFEIHRCLWINVGD